MGRYTLIRAAWMSSVLFGATFIVFVILRLAPGDPAIILLGPGATPEEITEIRHELGLDRPLFIQYAIFLKKAVLFDFGKSISYNQPVTKLVLKALPATVELSFLSFGLAIIISVPVGMLSAAKRYSVYDKVVMSGVLLGQSTPPFWLGIMLIFLFSLTWKFFPTSGRGTFAHLVLPAVTLATFMIAMATRLVRSGMLEVLNEEYIKTARAKGLTEKKVLWKHAFRNTLIPVVTILGLQMGTILGGAVVIETVFGWPGVGCLSLRAIMARDYPLVQACVLLSAIVFIIINFGLDIVYRYLDPRIRYKKE